MPDSIQRAYSVSELTREIKQMLEGGFPEVLLEAEISNFKPASSGHWYFTLKDSDAMIQAVMFKGSQRAVSFFPADGQQVRVRGNLSVYAQRGNYQIICSSMENAGEGRILQMLEERKRRLASEGLFAAERKKSLPLFPETVAVLSSETGAAVRDIIRVLRRRAPWLTVRVVPIPVQGDGAGEKIAAAVEMTDRLALGEVIILGRGGGSLEDLLAFSDEHVVRAVAACSTPLISAVGHEIDWALSDFAADLRAPTPSAAAEMLCAHVEELRSRVLTAGRLIVQAFSNQRQRLILALKPFRPRMLEESFKRLIQPHRLALDDRRQRLEESLRLRVEGYARRLAISSRELAACDPFEVLNRGYAMIWDTEGRVLGSAAAAENREKVRIQFKDGSLISHIEGRTMPPGPGFSRNEEGEDHEEL